MDMNTHLKKETGAFPETADIESSSDDYAARFSGASGQWMLEVQEKLTMRLLSPHGNALTVLDVGGGHGQLARPLCAAGHDVTVLGSAPECAHRIQDLLTAGQCRFLVGNVIELPFEDHAFDVAISFRMLTHCGRWEKLVSELCRVARRAVVVDYPTSQSVNRIAPWLFEAKRKVETNTRTWHLFRHDEVTAAFDHSGYRLAKRLKQFFFPMVVHRMLNCRPLSAGLEAFARRVGLTQWAGSPVIAAWEPVQMSDLS